MSGRGAMTTKRRAQRRARAEQPAEGRSVSAEITLLLNTLRELAAIRSTAEDAAGRILESAEGLLAFADKEEAQKAEEAILSIMAACGFHDLVGQRVTKIAKTLDHVIAARLGNEAGNRPGPKRKHAPELEGPAFPGGSYEQARVEPIFKKN